MRKVPDRIDMNQKSDSGNHHGHHPGQRIPQESETGFPRANFHPREGRGGHSPLRCPQKQKRQGTQKTSQTSQSRQRDRNSGEWMQKESDRRGGEQRKKQDEIRGVSDH